MGSPATPRMRVLSGWPEATGGDRKCLYDDSYDEHLSVTSCSAFAEPGQQVVRATHKKQRQVERAHNHTLSATRSPSRPRGRSRSTSMSMAKVVTSSHSLPKVRVVSASLRPRIIAPSTAPGTLPMA